MRKIELLVIHAAATPPGMDIGVSEIRRWHKQRGFRDVGYHFVIRRNGVCETGRPVQDVGAHVKGHNAHSIGICLVGGVSVDGNAEDNFTTAQYRTLFHLLKFLVVAHSPRRIVGHGDIPGVNKDCPCFDVAGWLELNKISEEGNAG